MTQESIFALATRCGVSKLAACQCAGVSYSTIKRIQNGSTPYPETLARLRAAIICVANSAGRLPDDLTGELDVSRQVLATSNSRDALELARSIERDAARLARVLERR